MKNTKVPENTLCASCPIDIRFSEVDSMNVVWHGSYPLYFEDAREAFGKKYNLGYLYIRSQIFFAPLVELNFHYKKPLTYGQKVETRIYYIPCDAAKIKFQYEIINPGTGEVHATGSSVQVFIDLNYNLVWENPEFYTQWKQKYLPR